MCTIRKAVLDDAAELARLRWEFRVKEQVTMAYVSPERRAQGIGRRLLDLIIDISRARNLEFLILWPSKRAVSFYERVGFRPASTPHHRRNTQPPLELEL